MNDRTYKSGSIAAPARASALAERQVALRARYADNPAAATVTKRARTGPSAADDPIHGTVVPENAVDPSRPYGAVWHYGIDEAVGGLHDAPNPAEMLCAALAACADSSIRMVADLLRVRLIGLEVEVSGQVDVRGTLAIDRSVPVGFEHLEMTVRIQAAPGTAPDRVDRLTRAAEHACVVLDTLRRGVPVDVTVEHPSASGGAHG
ncbi:OsmC family protein [Mycobacterium sp. Y57]|uniref:OsmC family protein n=1 Tax=Mycolicibacterium xanthum TaxID=2796469 RepID=UPI001C8432A1|nr:OsmC family protein [Mycolicibacterium xanthum]MBX7432220.1 OsmC family protein [Mycolicibacterium xanthum]